MHGATNVWEIKVSPLSHSIDEQATAVRFSFSEELLWTGTANGFVYANTVPSLEKYCSFKAAERGLLDVIPLPPSVSNGVISVSSRSVQCNLSGGLSRFMYQQPSAGEDLTACAVDAQSNQTVILGTRSGEISTLDIQTGKLLGNLGSICTGVEIISGGLPRGLMAVGDSSGEVRLVDPGRSFKAEHSIRAHSSSVVAMDASGSLLATAGLGTRQGRLIQDTIVKVYDLRLTARVMSTIPFSSGPSMLRFHPRYQDTLLIGASSGQFIMDHVQAAGYSQLMQVETEGDLLTSVDISSSGECLAFGGSGGFIHLWGFSSEPRTNLRSSELEIPHLTPQPASSMEEDQPFSISAQLYYTEERLASEWDPRLMGKPGQPPRTLDPALLKDVKQVDFVTYIPNPHFQRDKPYGEASKKVALLRNKRLHPKPSATPGVLPLEVDDSQQQHLPMKFRRLHITLDMDRRYEEFDFSRYNATRFAGLENGIANCYANALIQVLYFTPRLRDYFLAVVPDASVEFSLLDEMSLCFRMLASESGHACQATNLLRALRQSREATGLGLLEGHAQRGAQAADIEVEANKDRSLARRIQRLQRFLLDKLHHESWQRQAAEGQAATEASQPANAESEQGTAKGVLKKSVIGQTFGMNMRQVMEGLQGVKPKLDKTIACFQVDLQYPKWAPTPAGTSKGSMPAVAEGQSQGTRFGEVLAASLRAEGETRAWFNDQLKYQYVRQTRELLDFPQVMAVGTNVHDSNSRKFWEVAAGSDASPAQETSWAPWAMALDVLGGEVRVSEAASAADLAQADNSTSLRAVYELTAVVALVREELDGSPGASTPAPPEPEGHLVAHVRVPPSYLDKEVGTLPTPRAQPPSPGYSARKYSSHRNPFDPGPALVGSQFEGLPEDPFGEVAAEQAIEKEGAAAEHGLPADLFGDSSLPSTPVLGSADQDLRPATSSSKETSLEGNNEAEEMPGEAGYQSSEVAEQGNAGPVNASQASAGLLERFEGLTVSAERSLSFSRAHPRPGELSAEPVWLLINDFSIMQMPRGEAMQLFGGHKLPCLLYYTQVSAMQDGSRQDFKVVPRPVLLGQGQQAFHDLCRQPPLQAPLVGLHRLHKPTFQPLSPDEGPKPGLILGLDAEFVAFSPPTKVVRGGVEIETAPSRLGLARVSVVRGEGQHAGKACIDDFIRATEPVYDHLTQFSGLRAGDLDPAMSQHHLTTLKASYLKLRFLVDAGCIFVGHGLKKDFRMVNMLVPPEQVVDTVNLFYMKRQRKVSLKFLAAYLLGQSIQQTIHDSIEDARTALNLYKLYARLGRQGKLREIIEGMYAWGKQHSWESSALKDYPVPQF